MILRRTSAKHPSIIQDCLHCMPMFKPSEIIPLLNLLRLQIISGPKERHNWKSISSILSALPISIRSLRLFLSNKSSISQLISSSILPNLSTQHPSFQPSNSLTKNSTLIINFLPLKDLFSQQKTGKCNKPLFKDKNFTRTSPNSPLSKMALSSCLKTLLTSSSS